MKIKLLLKWLMMVIMIVIIGKVAFPADPLRSETIIKVPAKLNGVILQDSLFVRISSGGTQVEVKKFMALIGGSYHPFTHVFHQPGLMVQYGKFISFARNNFALGFVNLQMVSMLPPVTSMFIGAVSVDFAPLSFLAKAINGTVGYDAVTGRIDITVVPPSEFGSIFPPARDVALALDKSGYYVQQGESNKINSIHLCIARYSPDANGNNAAFPYLAIQLPPSPGKDSIYYIPLTFTLNTDEAVVMIGKTPPECKYFSYRSYLLNRYYDFPPSTTRNKIFASLGDSKSLYRMREDLPLDSMFRRKFAFIMSADSLVAMHIKSTILAATPAISEKDIYFDIIPNGIFKFGNNPYGDWTTFVHRASIFRDSAAEDEYINNPVLEIMRVTPKQSSPSVFFKIPPYLSKISGNNEFSLMPKLKLLEDGIYNAYHKTHEIIWLQPSPWVIEGFTAIQGKADALGEVSDALYIITSDFLLGENDIALVYGVNHTLTGQAVYNNVTIYGRKYWNGFGGITNFEMEKSARKFVADTVTADKLFAYSFARHPVPGNPFVYIVPSDPNKMLQGINVNDTAVIGTRLYVNTITKIGPDPLEVILDRTVLLRPIVTGITEYGGDKQVPAIKVFPNPVRDKAYLEFSIPEWSDISVVLYNSSGQQIGKALQIDHVRGTILQEMKLSGNLTSGTYIIRGIVNETGKSGKYNLTSKLLFLGEGNH
jgi:hypothetical protein